MATKRKQVEPALVAAAEQARAEQSLALQKSEMRALFAAAALSGLLSRGTGLDTDRLIALAFGYADAAVEKL